MQVAKEVLKRADDTTQVSLVYCNQTPDDILLWEELKEMEEKHDNFKVWYCGETCSNPWHSDLKQCSTNLRCSLLWVVILISVHITLPDIADWLLCLALSLSFDVGVCWKEICNRISYFEHDKNEFAALLCTHLVCARLSNDRLLRVCWQLAVTVCWSIYC